MEQKQYRHIGVSLEQAKALMEQYLPKGERCKELVALPEALGRIAAEDYISPIFQPPFPRSPLDGYAVRSDDIKGASREHPAVLTVTEEVDAGGYPSSELSRGKAVRIMTGAPIPEGADCIVKQEETDYGEEEVQIYQEHPAYDNYCYRGEDFKKGDCLVKKGTRITYVELGLLAGMGYDQVSVFQRPKVAVFATGDELTDPGKPLLPGKIYNSNLYLLMGRIREMGGEITASGIVPDNEEEAARVLKASITKADLVVTTGGVSVGKRDIIHGALEVLGAEKIFWKVQVKPGTPTVFSIAERTPVISLSGNPFGAVANLELLVSPLLHSMMGDHSLPPRRKAVLEDGFPKGGKVRRIVRGYYRDGKVYLPKGLHSSGAISSMRGCNCLLDIPSGSKGLSKGDTVEVILILGMEAGIWN